MDDLGVIEPTAAVDPRAAAGAPERPASPAAGGAAAVTQQLPAGVSGERCAQCGAALAPDQRYCLQCGEPRPHLGRPPLAVQPSASTVAPESAKTPPVPPGYAAAQPAGAGGRGNSLALIAGVGVLLLAMGVGVLIGRASDGSAKLPPTQVITVGGGSAAATTTPASGTAGALGTSTTAGSESGSTAKAGKKAAKAKQTSSAGSSISKPASSATALKSIDKEHENGKNYEEKSQSLPNVIETKK